MYNIANDVERCRESEKTLRSQGHFDSAVMLQRLGDALERNGYDFLACEVFAHGDRTGSMVDGHWVSA